MSSLDPEDLSTDQRIDEIASILARGVLHLHGRLIPHLSSVNQKLPESSQTCLDLSQSGCPHRNQTVNAKENADGGNT